MPTKARPSLDELLSKRQGQIKSTERGDALIKVATTVPSAEKASGKAPRSWDEETRTARFTLTSEAVDRYGDIVVQEGIKLDRFLQNPQALLFHNSRSWPIGMWSDIEKKLNGRPKRTEALLNFLDEGIDEDADRAARHVAAGSIRTTSIGFIPLDWESITDSEGRWTGYRITESELLECSLVPIPANPDCLAKDAAGDMSLHKMLLEEVLDNWSKDPVTGLVVPREQYEAAYRALPIVNLDGKTFVDLSTLTSKAAETEVAAQEALADAMSEASADDHGDKTSEAPEVSERSFDDLDGLSVERINELCEREIVFLTSYKKDGRTYGGTILAQSWEQAEKIAEARGADEKVYGQAVSLIPSDQLCFNAADRSGKGIVVERDSSGLVTIDAPEEAEVLNATPVARLTVDTSEVEEKISGVISLAERAGAALSRLFGTRAAVEEPAAPTDDDIKAARERAAEALKRSKDKGRL